jgi:hypothetical protein
VSILDDLRQRRQTTYLEVKALADRVAGENRAFDAGEESAYERLMAQLDSQDERIKEVAEQEQRAKSADDTFARLAGGAESRPVEHPLAVSVATLDGLQQAIVTRTAGRWLGVEEQRAALATGTYGAGREWGSNVIPSPRLLHVAAGVPRQEASAIYAQTPSYTLPTAQASVGENVTLSEYATVTAGSLTLARFGRWTDLSIESGIGTTSESLLAMHQTGIALDLDKSLITATDTASGAAVAFTSDVTGNMRKAIATVAANTAVDDISRVVVIANPADLSLIETVSPVGGVTIGEAFGRFAGALVYASSAVTAGFMYACVPSIGVRYFEAQRLTVESLLAPKTGTLTVASSVIAGYATNVVAGWTVKQDVVTP